MFHITGNREAIEAHQRSEKGKGEKKKEQGKKQTKNKKRKKKKGGAGRPRDAQGVVGQF